MVKVRKDQEMRFGRGNLAKARAAVAAGKISAAVEFYRRHAANRQRAAKSK